MFQCSSPSVPTLSCNLWNRLLEAGKSRLSVPFGYLPEPLFIPIYASTQILLLQRRTRAKREGRWEREGKAQLERRKNSRRTDSQTWQSLHPFHVPETPAELNFLVSAHAGFSQHITSACMKLGLPLRCRAGRATSSMEFPLICWLEVVWCEDPLFILWISFMALLALYSATKLCVYRSFPTFDWKPVDARLHI